MKWPQSLIPEVVGRRVIFFLGAGASASCEATDGAKPPLWPEFLNKANELVVDRVTRKQNKRMIKQGQLPLALQGIIDAVDQAEYRHLIERTLNKTTFRPGRLHKAVFDLDLRTVITTNFDTIYEKLCHQMSDGSGGFKVLSYTSPDLFDEIRSETRLIIKAHGCVSEIGKMVFSRRDYLRARKEYGWFFDILRALFLTNTVIFVGCGFSDPDINLLLEELTHLTSINEKRKPHYALVRSREILPVQKKDWKETFNIECLEYGKSFDLLPEAIEQLRDEVMEKRAEPGSW
jgi:hypothetical protein